MHKSARRPCASSVPMCLVLLGIFLIGDSLLPAQSVPTVQQAQFRSQWVGEQVDQIPSGGGYPPIGGLGALVGSLQTPDQVQREVEASLADLNPKSPFDFYPSLGVGWQFSKQGNQSGGNAGSSQSSGFAAPSVVLGYVRDHGPWTISAEYSAGYRYYLDNNYTGAGTGLAQNPLSQTAMGSAVLEMSRYHVNALLTASSGSGYDTTSASYNLLTSLDATLGMKYDLSSSTSIAANAGYSIENASASTATPNNNTTTSFADLSDIYDLSDKTHLSLVASVGRSSQGLQQGTATGTNAPLNNSQNTARAYGQSLVKLKYLFTDKLIFDFGFGARYVNSNLTNSQYTGLNPAWTLGVAYTPTEKTSLTFSSGLQASDVTPELNLLLSWNPRAKTQFTFGLSQSEQFANSLSGQYIVSRNLTGTVSQKLFSSVNLSLTGGYAMQNAINLSNSSTPGESGNQIPSSYFFGNLSVFWKIHDGVNLANTLTYSTGQQQGNSGGGAQPQYLYSISLNFSL